MSEPSPSPSPLDPGPIVLIALGKYRYAIFIEDGPQIGLVYSFPSLMRYVRLIRKASASYDLLVGISGGRKDLSPVVAKAKATEIVREIREGP